MCAVRGYSFICAVQCAGGAQAAWHLAPALRRVEASGSSKWEMRPSQRMLNNLSQRELQRKNTRLTRVRA